MKRRLVLLLLLVVVAVTGCTPRRAMIIGGASLVLLGGTHIAVDATLGPDGDGTSYGLRGQDGVDVAGIVIATVGALLVTGGVVATGDAPAPAAHSAPRAQITLPASRSTSLAAH